MNKTPTQTFLEYFSKRYVCFEEELFNNMCKAFDIEIGNDNYSKFIHGCMQSCCVIVDSKAIWAPELFSESVFNALLSLIAKEYNLVESYFTASYDYDGTELGVKYFYKGKPIHNRKELESLIGKR